jgi:hypothetical protein
MRSTNAEDLKELLYEDVFIVDRGFQDSLGVLEELGNTSRNATPFK